MGRSKPNVGCKKHPKHRQSPGVCSVCLGERLSHLSSKSSRIAKVASSSSSSSSLSSLSSHCSSSESPLSHVHLREYRMASGAKGSFFSLMGSKNVLSKSRFVAFEVPNGKKKGGFWSKLVWPRRTRVDEVFGSFKDFEREGSYKGTTMEVHS